MAVISSEERRLFAELVAHHEAEAEMCRSILRGGGGGVYTPREIARCRENLDAHTRFIRDLRLILLNP